MYQAKQQVGDLMVGPQDWSNDLPAGYAVSLRINGLTQKERTLPSGDVWVGTDLQWFLGNGSGVREAYGTALKMTGPDGKEVVNVFRRVAV